MRVLLLILLCAVTVVEMYAQDRSYGRSMVISDRGIVATSHYLASQAGAPAAAVDSRAGRRRQAGPWLSLEVVAVPMDRRHDLVIRE